MIHNMALLKASTGHVLSLPSTFGTGALAAGVDSVFVAGGIHAEDLQVFDERSEVDLDLLRDWLAAYSSKPTYVMPFLQP